MHSLFNLRLHSSKSNSEQHAASEEELFSASSLIRPYALQLDTCCFHGFRAQAEFPLLLLTFPPPLLSITRASSSTLVSFHFFSVVCFVLFFHSSLTPQRPRLQLPLMVPLQTAAACRWTWSPCPCTHARARSQTEAELLNGAAAGEISAQLHYWEKTGRFHQRAQC